MHLQHFLYGGEEGQIKNRNILNDSLDGKKRGKNLKKNCILWDAEDKHVRFCLPNPIVISQVTPVPPD